MQFDEEFRRSFRNFKIAYWTCVVLWGLILLSVALALFLLAARSL